MKSSVRLLRLAFPLAVSLCACVQASSGTGEGAGGAGAAGSNGGGGTTGGSQGGTTGGSQGGTTGGSQGGKSGGGGTTGGGGMVITGTGGRATGGATGQGGAPGLGGAMVNPDAGARPDLTGRKALFIVKSPSSLDDGEILLEQLVGLRGMTVTYGDLTTPPAMAAGFNLMIISSGLGSDTGVAVFKDVPIPTIVFYRDAFITMGFVAASAGRGSQSDGTPVTITDASTSLASDFTTGTTFLMTSAALHSSQYGWGIPGGAPIKVAQVMGAPTEFAVFAYEKGAAMGVGSAAARRVALGWKTDTIDALTVDGFKLQDAALSWTAGAP